MYTHNIIYIFFFYLRPNRDAAASRWVPSLPASAIQSLRCHRRGFGHSKGWLSHGKWWLSHGKKWKHMENGGFHMGKNGKIWKRVAFTWEKIETYGKWRVSHGLTDGLTMAMPALGSKNPRNRVAGISSWFYKGFLKWSYPEQPWHRREDSCKLGSTSPLSRPFQTPELSRSASSSPQGSCSACIV